MAGRSRSIVGLGASTAVGRDAWSSAAAVRAGISGFGEHPFMIDTAGNPMRVAAAPWLDVALAPLDGFQAPLLFPAIDQAFATAGCHWRGPGAQGRAGIGALRPRGPVCSG